MSSLAESGAFASAAHPDVTMDVLGIVRMRRLRECARILADVCLRFCPQDQVVQGQLSDRDTWRLILAIAPALKAANFIDGRTQSPLNEITWNALVAAAWRIYPKDDLSFGETLAAFLAEAKFITLNEVRG